MREVGVDELLATSRDPFVRHHPLGSRRGWVSRAATVVEGTGGRPTGPPPAPVFTCLGPATDLDPLMAHLADAGVRPSRLTVETASYAAVPPAWRHADHHRWHWMISRSSAPVPPVEVVEVEDPAEIDAVLDAANPGSFARPGTPGVECWMGIRDAGSTVAVGALVRQPDGTGHLRGVTVLPGSAGRGLGSALSAALTRRALARGPGVATLGVYVDNAPAIAIYRRLGYRVAHTFASGPVTPTAS
ncbi:MAG: mshD 1 [Nocardioides sp.]|nr:mshD 1 [Nocardioides sp.]